MFYKWRPKDMPEWNSIFAICFIFMSNYLVFIFFLGKAFSKNTIGMLAYGLIPLLVLLFTLCYFLFIRGEKYIKMLKKLSENSESTNKKGIIVVISCAVEALLIPWVLMLF